LSTTREVQRFPKRAGPNSPSYQVFRNRQPTGRLTRSRKKIGLLPACFKVNEANVLAGQPHSLAFFRPQPPPTPSVWCQRQHSRSGGAGSLPEQCDGERRPLGRTVKTTTPGPLAVSDGPESVTRFRIGPSTPARLAPPRFFLRPKKKMAALRHLFIPEGGAAGYPPCIQYPPIKISNVDGMGGVGPPMSGPNPLTLKKTGAQNLWQADKIDSLLGWKPGGQEDHDASPTAGTGPLDDGWTATFFR